MRVDGITTPEQASTLRNHRLLMLLADCPDLADGDEFYSWELVGMQVVFPWQPGSMPKWHGVLAWHGMANSWHGNGMKSSRLSTCSFSTCSLCEPMAPSQSDVSTLLSARMSEGRH